MRSLRGGEAGELVPTGYQGQASWRSRQQRTYLLRIHSVVQHDEHAPTDQHGAVESCLSIHVIGDSLGRGAERGKETA